MSQRDSFLSSVDKVSEKFGVSVSTPGKISARVFTTANSTAKQYDFLKKRYDRKNSEIEKLKVEKQQKYFDSSGNERVQDLTTKEKNQKEKLDQEIKKSEQESETLKSRLDEATTKFYQTIHFYGNTEGGKGSEEPVFEYSVENEIQDAQGWTSVNLNPDARIIIAGVEITGFLDCEVSMQTNESSLSPNTARITIADIDNRYTLLRRNLEDVWLPDEKEKQDLFKLKAFSKLPIFEGQAIFEVNDSVMIFLKDRFLPFWRFAFHGYINRVDNSIGYNNHRISLECEDAIKFVRMKKYNVNPAIFDPIQRNSMDKESQLTSGLKSLASGKSIPTAISSLFFGPRGSILNNAKMGYTYQQDSYGHIEVDDKQPPITFKVYTGIEDDNTENSGDNKQTKKKKELRRDIEKLQSQQPPLYSSPGVVNPDYVKWRQNMQGLQNQLDELDSNERKKNYYSRSSDYIKNDSQAISDVSGVFKVKFQPGNTTVVKTKYQFAMSDALMTAMDDLGSPAAEMISGNIGYFKQFRFVLPFQDKDGNRTPFSQVLDPYSLNQWYEEIPRWFITDIEWTGKEYTFSFLGFQGINPLLTSEFIDALVVTPKLIQTIENAGGFDLTQVDTSDLRNVPLPFDVVLSNTKGLLHTIYVRSGKNKVSLQVNPRVIVVLPYGLMYPGSGKVAELLDFGKFDLFSTELESAADILGKILKQTDLISWTTPCGDLVIEPKYYDTYPWHWTTRGSSSTFDNKKYTERLAVTHDESSADDLRSAQEELQLYQTIINNPQQYTNGELRRAFQNAPKAQAKLKQAKLQPQVHYVDTMWGRIKSYRFLNDDSWLDNVITEKDESQSTSTIDSSKFRTIVEVKGNYPGATVAGVITPQLIEEFGKLQSDGTPYYILVADGFSSDLSYEDVAKARKELLNPSKFKNKLVDSTKHGYDPLRDYIRKYGISQYSTQGLMLLINTKSAAKTFAHILFNRFLSDAFAINDIQIFGRPGLLPNRPVFVKSRNSVVTAKRITTKFSFGNDYSTVIQSGWMRNQSLMEGFGFSFNTGEKSTKRTSTRKESNDTLGKAFQDSARNAFANKEWKFFVNSGSTTDLDKYNFYPPLGLIDWNEDYKETEKSKDEKETKQVSEDSKKADKPVNKTSQAPAQTQRQVSSKPSGFEPLPGQKQSPDIGTKFDNGNYITQNTSKHNV